MNKAVILSTAMLLVLTCAAQGQQTGEIKLAPPYIDPVRGFSLRPPADTTCSRVVSANRLVIWTKRDSAKAPILWRLSLYARTDDNFKPGGDLAVHGRKLSTLLAKIEGFQAPPPRVIDVGPAKAINLRGVTTGKVRFWQRRVWVHLRGSKFLEVRMSGPVAQRDKLDAIASTVLKTLKLTDPKDAKAHRQAALKRGSDILKSLTDQKLTDALAADDQWFLYSRDGKSIGFMRQQETSSTSSGKSGCRVKSWIMMNLEGKRLKLHRDMFTTADRSIETWLETAQVVSPGRTVSMKEQGAKTGEQVDCEITVDKKNISQKPVNVPKENYLPRAMAWLLRKMVDLKAPSAQAFATYNGRSGNFNLRTFTVIGPEEIEVGGRKVTAVRVRDQLTAETQAADMWVDTSGNLLIMKTADGLVMERASEKAVERRFSKAKETIKSMGR